MIVMVAFPSTHGRAAVGDERCAVHERGVRREQPGDGGGDLLGRADPAQERDALQPRTASACSKVLAIIGISVGPSATQFTAMPRGPSSRARLRLRASTATVQPSRSNLCASAAPMPLAAPVTMARTRFPLSLRALYGSLHH